MVMQNFNPFRMVTQRVTLRFAVRIHNGERVIHLCVVNLSVPRWSGVAKMRASLNAHVNDYMKARWPSEHATLRASVIGRLDYESPKPDLPSNSPLKQFRFIVRIKDRNQPIEVAAFWHACLPSSRASTKTRERLERMIFDYIAQKYPKQLGLGGSIYGTVDNEF